LTSSWVASAKCL